MKKALVVWLALLGLGLGAPVRAQPPRVVHLVGWSDVHSGGRHFRPQEWVRARAEGLQEGPDALILLGDHGDNSHDQATFPARLGAFVAELGEQLQGVTTPLLLTLGNDDLAVNYQTDPSVLAQARQLFQERLKSRYYLDELGNGVYPGRPAGMVWLSLNTVIFSPYNHYAGAPDQARTSLAWLEQQLQEAQGAPVVLLTHIPPAWDLHSREPAWKREYLAQLRRLLLEHRGSITILGGHFHRNHVQAFRRPQGNVLILTQGALADKYGYQPNWRSYRWTLDREGSPHRLEYDVRYPGHGDWTRHYDLQPAGLEDFLHRLKTEDTAYHAYMDDVYGHHPDTLDWADIPHVREALYDEFWVQP